MPQDKITSALLELGLSIFEAKIYKLLLSLKNPSITDLCTETGSYRRKVYEALEKLSEFGLIIKENDYQRQITVKSPAIIDTLLKSKKYQLNKVSSDFGDILPNLLTNFFSSGSEPQIRVFEGENKFRYLFNTLLDELKGDSEILCYNESDDLYNIFDIKYFIEIWVEKRISKKVFAKVLVNETNSAAEAESLRDHKKYRKTRILPNSKNIKGCFWLVENKIILWDTRSPKALLIENELLFHLFCDIFNRVWKG